MEFYTNLTITDNSNGSVIFSCTTKPSISDDAENFLIELSGWDTYTGTEIKRVPKLIGSGSYLDSIHRNERELSITASLYDENEIELSAKKDLLGHTEKAEKVLTARWDFYEVSADRLTTTLSRTEWFDECLISGTPTWDKNSTEALIVINLVALNPEKNYTEWLAGVESTGITL